MRIIMIYQTQKYIWEGDELDGLREKVYMRGFKFKYSRLN